MLPLKVWNCENFRILSCRYTLEKSCILFCHMVLVLLLLVFIVLSISLFQYTEEEVERAYEEFYEDVHTEFLKFGEIVNFKVCRNGSSHLRGNVYVHFKSLDSAMMAYQTVNGRYFAGKQVQCEFVSVTKWRVAICGEYMKSKLQTCSRGMTCNFIHCFRNPGGDYEWSDWDRPAPRFWLKKMASLFGYSDESGYDKMIERESPRSFRTSSRMTDDADSYHSHRSQSRAIYHGKSSRNHSEYGFLRSDCRSRSDAMSNSNSREKHHHNKNISSNSDSDRNSLDRDRHREISHHNSRNRSRSHRKRKSESRGENTSDSDRDNNDYHEHPRRRSRRRYQENTYDSNSDEERNNTYTYMEKSPRSGCAEEFEDKKSRRKRAPKIKYSHWDREVGHDSGNPTNRGRSYRSSDSSSRDYSRKDARKLEQGEYEKEVADKPKKSKRKRDADKNFDSESRVWYREAKGSDSADYRIDERGRWEPE